MALAPISIGGGRPTDAIGAVLASGTNVLQNVLNTAVESGRRMADNQIRQEEQFVAERRDLRLLGERRGNELQRRYEAQRTFDESVTRDRRDFSRGVLTSDRAFNQSVLQADRSNANELARIGIAREGLDISRGDQRLRETEAGLRGEALKLDIEEKRADRARLARGEARIEEIFPSGGLPSNEPPPTGRLPEVFQPGYNYLNTSDQYSSGNILGTPSSTAPTTSTPNPAITSPGGQGTPAMYAPNDPRVGGGGGPAVVAQAAPVSVADLAAGFSLEGDNNQSVADLALVGSSPTYGGDGGASAALLPDRLESMDNATLGVLDRMVQQRDTKSGIMGSKESIFIDNEKARRAAAKSIADKFESARIRELTRGGGPVNEGYETGTLNLNAREEASY